MKHRPFSQRLPGICCVTCFKLTFKCAVSSIEARCRADNFSFPEFNTAARGIICLLWYGCTLIVLHRFAERGKVVESMDKGFSNGLLTVKCVTNLWAPQRKKVHAEGNACNDDGKHWETPLQQANYGRRFAGRLLSCERKRRHQRFKEKMERKLQRSPCPKV